MDPYADSSDRNAVDFVLFAVAFAAFLLAVGGVIVGSAGAAFAGGVLLLLAIALF